MKRQLRRLSKGGRLVVVAVLALALTGVVVAVAAASPKPKVPVPSLHPSEYNPTTSTSISFTFTDSQSGVSFKCSKDGSAFSTCHSPQSYSGLALGNHTFSVQAVSGSNTSGNASFAWKILSPPPPVPNITSSPASLTNATTASFHYTGASGSSFLCSLDGSNFKSCPASGITYSNLSSGNHTFKVEAQFGSGTPSAPATFSWLLDRTPPTVNITFPGNGGQFNAAGWSAGCSPVGLCGTASDPSGVQSVSVAIRQESSGKYWNGSSFSSSAMVFNAAVGTTSWKYAMVRPPDGKYTLSVRATDNLGNAILTTNCKSASFTIDTVPPAAPVITSKPSNPTKDTSPSFQFTDTTYPSTFFCRLDSGAVTVCTNHPDHHGQSLERGSITYNHVSPGAHCFYVYAVDPAGNVGPTTSSCWTITGDHVNFVISGNVAQPLSPGVTKPLTVTVFNPNSSALTIPINGISVAVSTTKAGCANSNFAGSSGPASAVTVGGGATITIPGFTVSMLETGVNQDDCKSRGAHADVYRNRQRVMKRRNAVPAIPPFIDFYGRPTFDNPAGQYRPNPALMVSAQPAGRASRARTDRGSTKRANAHSSRPSWPARSLTSRPRRRAWRPRCKARRSKRFRTQIAWSPRCKRRRSSRLRKCHLTELPRHPEHSASPKLAIACTVAFAARPFAMLAVIGVVGTGAGAYAAFSAHGSGIGSATTATIQSITISVAGTSGTSLLPTGSPMGDLRMSVQNGNSFSLAVTNIQQNGTISVDGGHPSCTAANAGVTVPAQAVTGVTIPTGTNVVDVLGVVQMATNSNNSCQGATFTIPVTIALKQS